MHRVEARPACRMWLAVAGSLNVTSGTLTCALDTISVDLGARRPACDPAAGLLPSTWLAGALEFFGTIVPDLQPGSQQRRLRAGRGSARPGRSGPTTIRTPLETVRLDRLALAQQDPGGRVLVDHLALVVLAGVAVVDRADHQALAVQRRLGVRQRLVLQVGRVQVLGAAAEQVARDDQRDDEDRRRREPEQRGTRRRAGAAAARASARSSATTAGMTGLVVAQHRQSHAPAGRTSPARCRRASRRPRRSG